MGVELWLPDEHMQSKLKAIPQRRCSSSVQRQYRAHSASRGILPLKATLSGVQSQVSSNIIQGTSLARTTHPRTMLRKTPS
jgi:hypothetical protein